MRKTLLFTLLGAAIAVTASAQQPPPPFPTPRPSPKASVLQTVGLTDITITYSRPSVKGRPIWGALVPYDQVWRTGANEATLFAVSDDVTVNGAALPKGTYSLHTIPGKDHWTIIFNKTANQWGSFTYDEKQDQLRITARPEKGDFHEWMTFDFTDLTMDTAKVVLHWENVAVPFTVNTGTMAHVTAAARNAVSNAAATDWRTPWRAATFAFDNKMTAEAQQWTEASIKAEPNVQNLWLKARMQQAAGDKVEAVKTARAAIAKATPADKDLVADIEQRIANWK
jgi:hypothetical protein